MAEDNFLMQGKPTWSIQIGKTWAEFPVPIVAAYISVHTNCSTPDAVFNNVADSLTYPSTLSQVQMPQSTDPFHQLEKWAMQPLAIRESPLTSLGSRQGNPSSAARCILCSQTKQQRPSRRDIFLRRPTTLQQKDFIGQLSSLLGFQIEHEDHGYLHGTPLGDSSWDSSSKQVISFLITFVPFG